MQSRYTSKVEPLLYLGKSLLGVVFLSLSVIMIVQM